MENINCNKIAAFQ